MSANILGYEMRLFWRWWWLCRKWKLGCVFWHDSNPH